VRSALGEMTESQRLKLRWEEYLKYEIYAEGSPERAFKAETQLLALLKKTAPSSQYIAGEFRGAFFERSNLTTADFIVPRRGTICRHNLSDGEDRKEFLDRLQDRIIEAMQLEERFDIKAAQPSAADAEALADCRLIHYLAWNNSPYLRTISLPEWRLGVFVLVMAKTHIILMDTESLCLDLERLGMTSALRKELQRLFSDWGALSGQNGEAKRTRIVEASSIGLDMSEIGIRAMSVRKFNLGESYFDLAEVSHIPSTVEGIAIHEGEARRRRLSIRHNRVADAISRHITVNDYVKWAKEVDRAMMNNRNSPHGFFGRFANELPPPDEENGKAESLLLDLWDALMVDDETLEARGWDIGKVDKLLDHDTCLEVEPVLDDEEKEISRRAAFAGCEITIEYVLNHSVPPEGRYRLRSADLDALLLPSEDGVAATFRSPVPDDESPELPESLVSVLNREQSFRVIPVAKDMMVYAHRHFFNPEIDFKVLAEQTSGTLLDVIEPCVRMAEIVSEKGETVLLEKKDWGSKTLFGFVDSAFAGRIQPVAEDDIISDISKCDLLVCHDGSTEICDFFALDQADKKLLLIHAKDKSKRKEKRPAATFAVGPDGQPGISAAKLQEVSRQALTSLAFVGVSGHGTFPLPKVWGEPLKILMKDAKGAKESYHRTKRRNGSRTVNCTSGEAHDGLVKILRNPRFAIEVVVLTSGILSKRIAVSHMAKVQALMQSEESAEDSIIAQRARQFIYYLAGVQSAFARAGVRLRLIANP